jgi:hypothetical protein
MKVTIVEVPDFVSKVLEKITNPLFTDRDIDPDRTSKMLMIYTEDVDNTLAMYADWSTSKAYLSSLLLISFAKNWNGNVNELAEIKKICADIIPGMQKLMKKRVGLYKITKAVLASAILHRIVSTQDVKEFFDKML